MSVPSSDYRSREGRMWPSEPPTDCPFAPSHTFAGLAFSGKLAAYTRADTWLLSWASDDRMYSPYMDGAVQDGDGTRGHSSSQHRFWL
jgi:hypothetical protein